MLPTVAAGREPPPTWGASQGHPAPGSKTAQPLTVPTTKDLPRHMATLLMVESWVNSTGRSLPPLLRDLGRDGEEAAEGREE